MRKITAFVIVLFFASLSVIFGQNLFSDLVGKAPINDVKPKPILEVPYLTWGADVGFFTANGNSLETKKGSTYDKLGSYFKFVNGDDFVDQVKRYRAGETPFLRGTTSMIGMASEMLGSSPRTKPVVILQLSWSSGDHVVSRKNLKTLNDLKRNGKKVRIAVQQGGPHVGLLYDILSAAQIDKNDVELVYTTDLIGPNGPAERFRKDATIDACCVITPDMIGLTGGLTSKGSGKEGTIEDAHVLVSTQTMSRSIADVLAVRKDWYDKNRDTIDKLVAGYMKGCVDLVAMRKKFSETNKLTPDYKAVLQMMQNTFGKDFLPTLEVDAHGMLLDATFVGLTGNISWFEDAGNLAGFEPRMKAALDMATQWGYAKERFGVDPSGLDYQKIAKLSGIPYEAPQKPSGRIVTAEGTNLFPDSQLDDRTILSFVVQFKANEKDFSIDQYGADFDRATKLAATFGNSVVVIHGHSDPTKSLVDLLKAGMEKGVITREGQAGSYTYKLNGRALDLSRTDEIVTLIKSGAFDGASSASPRETMQSALNLSVLRAEAVKKALDGYSQSKKFNLDLSQIIPVGAGISRPVVARPRNAAEAEKNMRVEFRIVRVDGESLKPNDFDY